MLGTFLNQLVLFESARTNVRLFLDLEFAQCCTLIVTNFMKVQDGLGLIQKIGLTSSFLWGNLYGPEMLLYIYRVHVE